MRKLNRFLSAPTLGLEATVNWSYLARRSLNGASLILGSTFLCFVLMVYFGPDQTYLYLGKNPTEETIRQVRAMLGYDESFATRYFLYLREIFSFDFGRSAYFNENVGTIIRRTAPVSAMVNLPALLLGNFLAIVLAMISVYYRGSWIDKCLAIYATVGMSVSLIVVLLGTQIILCSAAGLNLFPVQGWDASTPGQYLHYVAAPTIAVVFVGVGYHLRFYRAIIAEEFSKHYVRTARAFGIHPLTILCKQVLRNTLVPISTRLIYSIPFLFITGALTVEQFFNIPGIGRMTYDAMMSGDQQVVKAITSITVLVYALIFILVDVIYRLLDPRIQLK